MEPSKADNYSWEYLHPDASQGAVQEPVDVAAVEVEGEKQKQTLPELIGTHLPWVATVGVIVFFGATTVMGMSSSKGKTKALSGPDDRIAIAIGHAEGTRTCDGGKTRAYAIHRDPGDGKTNGGTFSAAPRGNGIAKDMTPEQRDESFLKNINAALATTDTSKMSELELATFVDLKVQAHPDVSQQFAKGSGPIVDRRVQSFFFGGKNKSWTTEAGLRADQQRRHDRLSDCLT